MADPFNHYRASALKEKEVRRTRMQNDQEHMMEDLRQGTVPSFWQGADSAVPRAPQRSQSVGVDAYCGLQSSVSQHSVEVPATAATVAITLIQHTGQPARTALQPVREAVLTVKRDQFHPAAVLVFLTAAGDYAGTVRVE